MSLHAKTPDNRQTDLISTESQIKAIALLEILIRDTVAHTGNAVASDWLDTQLATDLSDNRRFDLAFGLAPRKLGKTSLRVNENNKPNATINGWAPDRWQIDEAFRALILCRDHDTREHNFARLARHADLGEQLALYKALPLLPGSEPILEQVFAGLRTNMQSVFEAIAHYNPWPCSFLNEHRWNHLVLKALFVDSELAPIVGLDDRANPELARMLVDYADERRAADREISVELWRCVLPFVDNSELNRFNKELPS